MERKQGVTNLERMCEEIEEEERIKEQRKELKRQKKKRKKALAKSERENQAHQTEQEASHCEVSHGVQSGLQEEGGRIGWGGGGLYGFPKRRKGL